MSVLPTIDISLINKSRPELRESLLAALKSTGFFYLKGIPTYDSTELLNITKWFFNLADETKFSLTKKMFNKKSNHYYRGYFPVQPNEISHKEGFEIGPCESIDQKCETSSSKEREILEEANQWPQTEDEKETRWFQERMKHYYKIFTEAGIELLRLLAESLNLDSEELAANFCPNHLSTFRLLHYPPRKETPPKEAVDKGQVLQCSEHKDSGFFTLLSTFDYEGLQIRGPDDEWIDVPNVENCLVVNIGQLLATISGGLLKATNHRVVDKGEDRFSCPFFLEPNFDANVNISFPSLRKIDVINDVDITTNDINKKNADDLITKEINVKTNVINDIKSKDMDDIKTKDIDDIDKMNNDDIKTNKDDIKTTKDFEVTDEPKPHIHSSINDDVKYGIWLIKRMKQFSEFKNII